MSNKDSRDQVQVQEGSSSSSFSSSPQQLASLATGTMDGWKHSQKQKQGRPWGGPPGSSTPPQQNHQPLVVLLLLLAAVPPAEASGLGTLTLLRGAAGAAWGTLYCCDITRPRPLPCLQGMLGERRVGAVGVTPVTEVTSVRLGACKNTQQPSGNYYRAPPTVHSRVGAE